MKSPILYPFNEISQKKNESLKYQAMLVAAINTTPDTIVITDDQAKIKFMNHAAEELLGYTLADLKDEPITKFFVHDKKR